MTTFLATGCASGIGRHLAGALSRRGHRVIAVDVNETGLAAAAAADRWDATLVTHRALDVRDARAWEATLDAAGEVDVLLNIAGVIKPGWVIDVDAAAVDLHVDVNVKGVIHGTRAAGRRMAARGSGHIVNFGSLASLAPVPGLSLYTASKFAVRGFSLAAAQELKPRGVFVTVLLPDAVQTPMLDLQVAYDEAALTFSGAHPLRVEDIEAVLVERILPERPLEIAVPAGRAFLARVANVFPGSTAALRPLLERRGRKRQEAERAKRG